MDFFGRRVIEQTINEKLPDDFQTAEFLLEHGQLDKVVHRKEMKETLAQLLKLHQEVKKMLDFENHFWNKNKIESLKQSQEKNDVDLQDEIDLLEASLERETKKYIPILSLGIECKLHVFKKDLRH